mmetsp:Transcript_46467/g.134584  ORF Transcript_46467/g.134584 Transcript_46467/m.134584 type:complete len:88 (-) Transcript_46467:710-973(-)
MASRPRTSSSWATTRTARSRWRWLSEDDDDDDDAAGAEEEAGEVVSEWAAEESGELHPPCLDDNGDAGKAVTGATADSAAAAGRSRA